MPMNWWGGMTGPQAVQMGMDIFGLAQQQAQMQRDIEERKIQQEEQKWWRQMQLGMQQERLTQQKGANLLRQLQLRESQYQFGEREKRYAGEAKKREERWQEEMGFKREQLRERKLEKPIKPDLSLYPVEIAEAMEQYEQTGNWGLVQAIQKKYGIPVEKTPGKIKEMQEATRVWNFAEQQGLPLIVDRKFGPGGEEMALPHEVVERYGAETIQALQRIGGILGTDKYRQYTIPQLYEMYFRAKRFRTTGYTQKEIIKAMKEANISDDLITDIIRSL